jgi:hypothetical protein
MNQVFLRCAVTEEKFWTTFHNVQVIENEGRSEMRVEEGLSAKFPNGPLCRESLPYPP